MPVPAVTTTSRDSYMASPHSRCRLRRADVVLRVQSTSSSISPKGVVFNSLSELTLLRGVPPCGPVIPGEAEGLAMAY